MACEVADGLSRSSEPVNLKCCKFQWPVKWPMVCAVKSVLGEALRLSVSMACEVADGLRPGYLGRARHSSPHVSMACEVADGLRPPVARSRRKILTGFNGL